MRIFFDTHVWLWTLVTPERIDEKARRLLVDPGNGVSEQLGCSPEPLDGVREAAQLTSGALRWGLRSSSAALRRFSAGFAKQLGSLSEPAYSVEGNLLIVSRHEAPFSVDEVDGVDTVDRKRRGDVHHVHHVHFVHQGSGASCLVEIGRAHV